MCEFRSGFIAGLVAAGVLGYVLQQLRLNRNKMADQRQPQVVVLSTDKSPVAVVGSSLRAWAKFIFWIVVLAFAVWGFVSLIV